MKLEPVQPVNKTDAQPPGMLRSMLCSVGLHEWLPWVNQRLMKVGTYSGSQTIVAGQIRCCAHCNREQLRQP